MREEGRGRRRFADVLLYYASLLRGLYHMERWVRFDFLAHPREGDMELSVH